MERLSIYHIVIDRFAGSFDGEVNANCFMGGSIRGVISNLEYISSMGFNTLYISPFTKSSNYHGYHVEDYFEVDPHFGTLQDMCELVSKSRGLGLKLMMDFVPNHCSCKHPFFQSAIKDCKSPFRDWFYINDDGSYKCFLDLDILPKFNLHNKATADYLISACKYWCGVGFDYVRIDHVIGLPFSFVKRLLAELKLFRSSIKLYGEAWAAGLDRKFFNTVCLKDIAQKYIYGINQEQLQMDYIPLLDGVLDFTFSYIMQDGIAKDSVALLQSKISEHFKNYPSNFDLILMLDNHDTNRFLFHCNNKPYKLLKAIRLMVKQRRSFAIYYGTECAMCNKTNIFNGREYADLDVRELFDKSTSILSPQITKILHK